MSNKFQAFRMTLAKSDRLAVNKLLTQLDGALNILWIHNQSLLTTILS